MNDLTALPDAPLGRYRHYKGPEYEVLGLVRHSETLEPLVLYRPVLKPAELWVRPHAMFFGTQEFNGRVVTRFTKVD